MEITTPVRRRIRSRRIVRGQFPAFIMFKLVCIAALASLAELDRALGNDELARGEFAYVARPLAVPVTASR